MPEETSGSPGPFDIGRLRELIDLMEKHDLSEIDLRQGDQRWKLRRGPAEVMQMLPASGYAPPSHVPAPAPAPPGAPAEVPEDKDTIAIKSPTVGTFYEAPAPGDPPFVTAGSRVTADSIVCIIEAMKVFNQIPAEVNGTIVEVLVSNGDAVEFGQPLFRVRLG
jgi:acetyl-CoA carboxylase biotin carboxyl carrier protein